MLAISDISKVQETKVIKGKSFVPFITQKQIDNKIKFLAQQIDEDYQGLEPILIGVLNGAYMFTSDLTKQINTKIEVTFVRCKSYQGTQSTGNLFFDLPFDKRKIKNRHVILVEDIVDTGLTMHYILEMIKNYEAKSVRVATLLYKPNATKFPTKLDYVGFEINNCFVVGYGLDYDGFGRNLKQIYLENS